METVNDLFLESLLVFVRRLVDFAPNILVMFLVVFIGVVISTVIRFILLWLLGSLKFDSLAERWGIHGILTKGGMRSAPSRIVSSLSYWGVLSVFFLMGFIALDILPINNFISDFLSYLPSIIAAVLIIIIGLVVGTFGERAVHVAAGNAGIEQAEIAGKGVKLLIVIMTVSMALDQLGIARGIIIAAFSITFGGVVFAISLAFGLGAKDMAREFLEKRLRKNKENKDSGI